MMTRKKMETEKEKANRVGQVTSAMRTVTVMMTETIAVTAPTTAM